jgi:hypothetical protein
MTWGGPPGIGWLAGGRDAADVDELEAERLDALEHSVERGLVGDLAAEDGVRDGVRPSNAAISVAPRRPRTVISYVVGFMAQASAAAV